jgi:hypothetical protein
MTLFEAVNSNKRYRRQKWNSLGFVADACHGSYCKFLAWLPDGDMSMAIPLTCEDIIATDYTTDSLAEEFKTIWVVRRYKNGQVFDDHLFTDIKKAKQQSECKGGHLFKLTVTAINEDF